MFFSCSPSPPHRPWLCPIPSTCPWTFVSALEKLERSGDIHVVVVVTWDELEGGGEDTVLGHLTLILLAQCTGVGSVLVASTVSSGCVSSPWSGAGPSLDHRHTLLQEPSFILSRISLLHSEARSDLAISLSPPETCKVGSLLIPHSVHLFRFPVVSPMFTIYTASILSRVPMILGFLPPWVCTACTIMALDVRPWVRAAECWPCLYLEDRELSPLSGSLWFIAGPPSNPILSIL